MVGVERRRTVVCAIRDAVVVVVRIARVPDAIPVGVPLVGIRRPRTVVRRVVHPVAVLIGVARVPDPVPVHIRLAQPDVRESRDDAGHVAILESQAALACHEEIIQLVGRSEPGDQVLIVEGIG